MQISRRSFVNLAGSAAFAWHFLQNPNLTFSQSTPATTTLWQQRAAAKRELTRGITWLTHEPIEFIIRRDGPTPNLQQQYDRMCDPENIKRMSAAGVRWGRIFFYKGFGLQYEKAHMDIARKVVDQMHSLGMKVSLYVGGTMFIETLYKEIPEAQTWEQRDSFNQPVPYGNQTYRNFACPNEPKYRDYMKRVLDIAVNDFHADEIAFDNFVLQDEPKSCRCPRCMKAFADYLAQKYSTKEAATARFGQPDITAVKLAPWKTPDEPTHLTEVDNPILQEWIRFRCQSLANSAADLYDHVKSLNPATACLFNIKGVYSFNRYWAAAVYHPMFTDHVDLMAFDTGGYDEHIDPKSTALVSQLRSYKVARRINTACEDSLATPVRAAVHMAFGYQKPVAMPTPWGSGAHNSFTPQMEFFREYNQRFYTGTESVADVAVLHNWPSMAYSLHATAVPVTLIEQVLIQYKVPFEILFDEQIDRLKNYNALIAAGQECMSDAQIQTLLDYVRGGKTLIATGNTAAYDEQRRKRTANPFNSSRTEGSGRIVYIPEIIPAVEIRPGAKMTPAEWVLPKNHAAIYQSIADAIPAGFSITAAAPLTTLMELLHRPETRETIAHFINFDQKPTAPFEVELTNSFDSPAKTVLCYSVDTDEPTPLEFKESGKRVKFTVPATHVYSMVVIAT